jgi:hypothetical protein
MMTITRGKRHSIIIHTRHRRYRFAPGRFRISYKRGPDPEIWAIAGKVFLLTSMPHPGWGKSND